MVAQNIAFALQGLSKSKFRVAELSAQKSSLVAIASHLFHFVDHKTTRCFAAPCWCARLHSCATLSWNSSRGSGGFLCLCACLRCHITSNTSHSSAAVNPISRLHFNGTENERQRRIQGGTPDQEKIGDQKFFPGSLWKIQGSPFDPSILCPFSLLGKRWDREYS